MVIENITIRTLQIINLFKLMVNGYMAAFFRQVKIGVLTLTLEKKQ